MTQIPIKPIDLPPHWLADGKIHWHNLADLEPDYALSDDLIIDEALIYFGEDLSYFTYADYFIDIGFYGDYSNDRQGTFGILIAKGDWHKGEVYENLRTRSLQTIVNTAERYGKLILSGEIAQLKSLPFEHEIPMYSALNLLPEIAKSNLIDRKLSISEKCQLIVTTALNGSSLEFEQTYIQLIKSDKDLQIRQASVIALGHTVRLNKQFFDKNTLPFIHSINEPLLAGVISDLLDDIEVFYDYFED